MNSIKITFIVVLGLFFMGFQSFAQSTTKLGKLLGTVKGSDAGTGLSKDEIVKGLKEALIVGIGNGSAEASKLDGFLKNELIKIAVPPEARKVEETLRKMGMGDQVDRFVLSLNRAAEDAAKKSKPIFVSAITSMTITDALGLLKGADTSATAYLRKSTNAQLFKTFYPVVDSTLNVNKATKYYADMVNAYNQLPLVKKVNPDLKQYATQKAIDGLYHLISEEEKKIRKDPVARVNTLLKKVFGNA